jgi:hypothetical protein
MLTLPAKSDLYIDSPHEPAPAGGGGDVPAVRLQDRPRMVVGTEQIGRIELPSSVPYLVWLALAGGFFIFRYMTAPPVPLDALSLWLVTLVTVVHLFRAVAFRRDPLSPDAVFAVFFPAFHFSGHLAGYLGVTYNSEFLVPFDDRLNPALLFSAAFLVLFLIGYELRGVRSRTVPCYGMRPTSPLAVNLAQALFFLAAAAMLLDVVRSGGRVLSVQYENAMYTEGEELFRGWAVGKQLATVAIFIYVAASIHARSKLFQNYVFLGLVVLYVGILFMSGKRGSFLVAALPPLFLYHHFVRRVRLRWLVVLALLFIPTIPAMKYMREEGGSYSFSRLARGLSQTESPFLETLAEAGASYRVVNAGMHYADLEGPKLGKTYVAALAKVVPYLGGYLYPADASVSPSLWLTLRHQGGGAGMGGSVALESYVNFGAAGLLVAVVLGWLYRLLYERALLRPSMVRTFLLCAATLLLMRFVRSEFAGQVRPLVWGTCAVLLLDRLTARWSEVRG